MISFVMKRDDKEKVEYNRQKIFTAISKANNEVEGDQKISDEEIDLIISSIEEHFKDQEIVKVEDIQDMVENLLMAKQKCDLSKKYITYRFKRALIRKSNSTDESILSLIRGTNEEVQRENSNKKPSLNSTMRDLAAGEVSKDLSRRILLPEHIIQHHDRGDIHFHDMDYFMMPEINCCLPNFREMLKHGTAINGVKIQTPKSFRVACNQVTQIMASVSSNQYGGQTFYSDVLGEYLAYTEKKFRKRITKTVHKGTEDLKKSLLDGFLDNGYKFMIEECIQKYEDQMIDKLVEEELRIELKAGVQCIQYQINTLCTCNGQSPFVTIFMYLRDDDPYLKENAMIVEEILKQRIQGLQNKDGVWVTPAFPKLIYVLGENNHKEGTPFYYITKLAAECTAKRMYPDYISEKVMKENYNGHVFGCMGCVDGKSSEIWWLNEGGTGKDSIENVTSFEEFWTEMSKQFEVKSQNTTDQRNQYILPKKIKIWDTMNGYVDVTRVNQNYSYDWVKVTFKNGKIIDCTNDHPFIVESKGVVPAEDLEVGDQMITGMEAHDITSVVEIKKYHIPDGKYSYDVTTESGRFEVNGIYTHNCRSFLSLWVDPKTGEPIWEGRFNQGVVTLNLPMIALDSGKDEDEFWRIFEERLIVCREALMCRHKALEGVTSDVSPIHWQDGGIARLKPGEKIDELLHGGFSTLSLGYIGLYETVKYMTGKSHTKDEGREFSLRIMQRMKDAILSWKAATGIGFALYGTPAESTCYTLCKKMKNVHGEVKDVTDKEWLTNSYHVDVREKIDALAKLGLESVYQKISSGGAISYIEIPNMQNNIEALLSVIEYMYQNMQYAEFNTRSDHCSECGYEGEIRLNENKEWQCPKCGCTDHTKLCVVRRTCGYLGTLEADWNIGKTDEINERVLHL